MRVPLPAWLVILGCSALPAGAQVARGLDAPPPAVTAAIAAGDEDHTGLRPMEALEHFREALAVDPAAFDALWRASRESLALGELAASDERRDAWYAEAVDHARAAVAAAPDRPQGHALLARSLWADARTRSAGVRARRSEEILSEARRTLALDPSNATAHRVLGEWHADVMGMSTVTRWAAERLMGDILEEASWEAAEDHLRLAVSVEPQGLAHHFALGMMLLRQGRTDEGRAALRQVLDRPTVEPVDPLLKQRARDLLLGG